MKRRAAEQLLTLVVVLSMGSAACGGSSKPDSPVASRSESTVSDESVAPVSVVPGEVDPVELDAQGAALLAMTSDEQEAYVSDLAMRFERELAVVSGLEEALGGSEATDLALREAWAPIIEQARALKDTPLTLGLRRKAPAAGPNIGEGLFGGLIVVTVGSEAVVGATNDLKVGEKPEPNVSGDMRAEGTLEEASISIDTTHESKDGVITKFKTKATVLPCPDADGRFKASAKIDISASKGSVGQTGTMDITLEGQVDDNAELVSKDVEFRMQWADFAGGKGQFVDVSGNYTGNSFNGVRVNRTGGRVTESHVVGAVSLGAMFGLMLAGKLADAAQKGWESGRCVQLDPTASPGPKDLEPSSTSTITAAPRSKIDGGPVGGTVKASLTAGGASVDSADTKVPADATFIYTAPDEAGQGGTVKLEARSRRGVARAVIEFTTGTAPTVVIHGAVDFTLMGMVGTAKFDLTMVPGDGETYTGTADLQLSGAFNAMLTTCVPATWAESIDLTGTLTSENDESVLVISTIGEPPRGSPVPMECTTAGVTVQSKTSLISSSLFGDLHVRLVDGDQAFVDTISPATGTVTVTVS